jgi:hypothetical protein
MSERDESTRRCGGSRRFPSDASRTPSTASSYSWRCSPRPTRVRKRDPPSVVAQQGSRRGPDANRSEAPMINRGQMVRSVPGTMSRSDASGVMCACAARAHRPSRLDDRRVLSSSRADLPSGR